MEHQQKYELPQQDNELYGSQPHPCLQEPLLYITNLPSYVTNADLAAAFVTCSPCRPRINRDGAADPLSGVIEFKTLDKAEKALATLQGRPIPSLPAIVPLFLSPFPPTNPSMLIPKPGANMRIIKQLPPGYSDSQLYDLFRHFGSIESVHSQSNFGPDTGIVEFWYEEDAIRAEAEMHCVEVEGHNISVQGYQPKRNLGGPSEFNTSAPAFIPSGSNIFQYTAQYSPPPVRSATYTPITPIRSPAPFVHGPGQQVQFAGPGNSHSGLIDPCNLFCKNLDSGIDSNALFHHFRRFGQIVSARVMRTESGESRGFGFVSFQTPDQASAALRQMNGSQLGSKQIVVRLHEPKQMRQEKLAHRFNGHNGHPRSTSGATSPTQSEAGESFSGFPSPRRPTTNLQNAHFDRNDRTRRGSSSYYNAALSGNLGLSMRYDDLASLSPVVRKEVLTGEYTRRVKGMDFVAAGDVDSIVESLTSLSLSETVKCMEDSAKLFEQVKHISKKSLSLPKHSVVMSPVPSISQTLVDGDKISIASPQSNSPPAPTPAPIIPTASSSSSAPAAPLSERDRMLLAVSKLESSHQAELTDLLMSLTKRERAMCLFNNEVLRAKLVDAKNVLDSEEDDPKPAVIHSPRAKSAPPPPQGSSPTTHEKVIIPEVPPQPVSAPETPAPVPTPPAPGAVAGQYTVAALAQLPAIDIIRLAASSTPGSLPIPSADQLVVKETDEFIDSLKDLPTQTQKQKVGDKLFKIVKSLGVKQAPKVTIALLDQEDIRSLAHLMNSYPAVLKNKALAVTITR